MGDVGFRGVSAEQDGRFSNKEAALLRKMTSEGKFPPEFQTKVDTRKVEMAVMKPWIAKKVSDLLGFEDDIVIEYVNGLLEDPENPVIDAKKMQILLTGFLEAKTPEFMRALWSLLLSAQASPLKVPAELLEQKKQEMRAREQAEAVKRRSDEARPPPPQSRFGDRPQRGGRGGRGGQSGRGGGFRGDKSSREHDKPPVRAYDDDADPSRRIPRDYYDDRRRDRSRSPDRRRRSYSPDDRPPPRRARDADERDQHSPPPRRRRYSPDPD